MKKKKAAPKSVPTLKLSVGKDLSSVIIGPRITEKAAYATERNVYTFIVRKESTKNDVRNAIEEIYDVMPVKVRIVNKKPRHYTSRMRGIHMMEHGMKKAYVYLKEGDRIDLA